MIGNSTSWYRLEKTRSKDPNRYSYTHIHSDIIIHNIQKVETTQMSVDRWVDKENVICVYNGVLVNLKKE